MDQSRKPSGNSESGIAAEAVAIVPDEADALAFDTEILEGRGAREALDIRLRDLQAEITIIRDRFHAIKHQARIVARENIGWIDDRAHEQLGSYPWLKLFGVTLAAFMTGKLLRRLPTGLLAMVAMPLFASVTRADD